MKSTRCFRRKKLFSTSLEEGERTSERTNEHSGARERMCERCERTSKRTSERPSTLRVYSFIIRLTIGGGIWKVTSDYERGSGVSTEARIKTVVIPMTMILPVRDCTATEYLLACGFHSITVCL